MNSGNQIKKYTLLVDTTAYSGNFEREITTL